MTTTEAMRIFQVGTIRAEASHAWKTNAMARGARRFSYIYRVCRIASDDGGDTIKIRLTGLKSRPVREVPRADVLPIDGIERRLLSP